jgi:hypothetical protein
MDKINDLFLENYGIDYNSLPDLVFTRDLYDDDLDPDEAYEIIVETLQDEGEL